MESFIGLTVRVELLEQPGTALEGVVSSIDAEIGSIELSPVLVRRNGGAQQQVSLLVVRRADIASLAVISLPAPPPTLPEPSITHPTKIQPQVPEEVEEVENVIPGVYSISATELNGGEKKPKRSRKKVVKDPLVTTVHQSGATEQQQRRNDPFPEEFNFSAGLLSFDKSAIFAEISAADSTDPSLRLHSHNRNNNQTKLLPNENVLSAGELGEQDSAESLIVKRREMVQEGMEGVTQAYREKERGLEPIVVAPAAATTRGGRAERKRKARFVNEAGLRVVEVRLKQYREILSIVDIETGPNSSQRTENSARSLASFLLSRLLPSSTTSTSQNQQNQNQANSQNRPKSKGEKEIKGAVCILCSADTEKGILGLKTGGHLLNRGIEVKVYVLSSSSTSVLSISSAQDRGRDVRDGRDGRDGGGRDGEEEFKIALRSFSAGGGRIIRDLEDLTEIEPTEFTFILDALSDPEVVPSSTASPYSPSPSVNGRSVSASTPTNGNGNGAENGNAIGGRNGAGGGEMSSETQEVVRWASEGKIVSIDSGFGTDHDTGLALHDYSLLPSILVSRGALRPSIHSLSRRSAPPNSSQSSSSPFPSSKLEVILLDSGFFPTIWSRVGLDNMSPETFGKEFWCVCSGESS